jgi:serine phosphatase RsbU (regulator of sigma subunit)
MRLPFTSAAPAAAAEMPQRSEAPQLQHASIEARYAESRSAGDFFDFIPTRSERLIFLLLDIAGKRDQAAIIATAVQKRVREAAPQLFTDGDINESTALTELALELNRAILDAAGHTPSAPSVRCTPAFLGCYSDALGILWYINAGHVPGLLRDADGVSLLEPTGLPMGLFAHAIHDAALRVLAPNAALLVASKGLIEARAHGEEFGSERLRNLLASVEIHSAQELCQQVLASTDAFLQGGRAWRIAFSHARQDDRTALALVRSV